MSDMFGDHASINSVQGRNSILLKPLWERFDCIPVTVLITVVLDQ